MGGEEEKVIDDDDAGPVRAPKEGMIEYMQLAPRSPCGDSKQQLQLLQRERERA